MERKSESNNDGLGEQILNRFHEAQELLLENGSVAAALSILAETLDLVKDDAAVWANYIRGTIAYLENDASRLEECVASEEVNRDTLERLLNGLKSRGYPNYSEDY